MFLVFLDFLKLVRLGVLTTLGPLRRQRRLAGRPKVVAAQYPWRHGRGRGMETPEERFELIKFDASLVAVVADAGLHCAPICRAHFGDVQRWDGGSGRITVVAPRPTWWLRAPWWLPPPSPWGLWDAIRRRVLVAIRGCSGCRNADRPPGEGNSQGRRLSQLSRLQQPQRAGGHGPERRSHPRDRTPVSLEARQRRGRPLPRGEAAGTALRYLELFPFISRSGGSET